uniref:Uncharacterized protein n=1 Tax=Anguilla anguilla TaxID=7936 RepID=A0A0E9XX26_ANGAN
MSHRSIIPSQPVQQSVIYGLHNITGNSHIVGVDLLTHVG